jgi:O-antigen/teichoic acid export membrane protein
MFSMLTASFEGFKRIKYRVYTDHIFLHGTKLALVVALGFLGCGVLGIALSHTIAMILTFFLAFYFLNSRVYPFFKSDIKPTRMKRELLSFSLPLMLAVFMGSIMMWIDTLMLGYFRNAADVGVYNVAHPTAWLLCFIVAALSALFLPVITELYTRHKKGELEIVSKTVTKWVFYFNLPFLLLLIFFSKQILNVVCGPEYIAGYAALGILSFGFFVTSINMTSYHILNVLKRTKSIFCITAVCAAINVVLNIVLIPVWGINGAALASALTYIIMTILLIIRTWQIALILPFSKTQMFKSAVIGIISIVLIYVIGRVLFSTFTIYIFLLLGLAFLVLYALLLLVFGGIEKEDIEILRAIEKKSGVRSERLRNFIKKFIKQ